jgi:hypothetical protein
VTTDQPAGQRAADEREADALEADGPARHWSPEAPLRRELAVSLAVAAAAFAAFLWRLLPGVGFWDTAIFQAAPPVLGLTHPTGYPTYLILGWAWVHGLWFLAPATALNVMTAVAGALAVGMVAALAMRLGAGIFPAAAGALTVGLMTSFWRTSARADPHPLHVLLALTIVALLLAWDRRRQPRLLAAAALVFGLAMGNHALTAMLAPGIGVFVVTRRPAVLREPRTIAVAVAALAAGLLVYAYVVVRGAANPPIHYDYAPDTWSSFWRYVLGQDFSGSMGFFSASGPGAAVRELPVFLGRLGDALTPPVAAGLGWLALVGCLALVGRRSWRTAWLLLATGGVTLYARLTYSNGDIERYALFPMAVLGILAGLGAQVVLDRLARALPAFRRGVPTVRPCVAAVAPAVLLLVPLALVPLNQDHVRPVSARCFVDAVERDVPRDAYLVSWWSMSTPVWYAQAVEGARPDITVLNVGSAAVDAIRAHRGDGRPIWVVLLSSDLQRVQDAGFTLDRSSLCGVDARVVTGGG